MPPPKRLLLAAVGAIAILERVEAERDGYGKYCHEEGEVKRRYTNQDWTAPPVCVREGVQDGEDWGHRTADYESGFQVIDLSAPEYQDLFCCKSNYTTIISRNTTVAYLDTKARRYHEAASRVLARFNCRDFYPYFNCTPCEQAYRSWVCSVMFPRKCHSDPSAGVYGHKQKVCKDVCFEVVRRCPVELEFHCPTDDSYGNWGNPKDWEESAHGPFRGLCNPMQLNIDSAARHAANSILVSAFLFFLILVL